MDGRSVCYGWYGIVLHRSDRWTHPLPVVARTVQEDSAETTIDAAVDPESRTDEIW